MQKKELTPEFLSEFCKELSLLIHAGITVSDGLTALSKDFNDSTGFFYCVKDITEKGGTLYEALSATGQVPSYMLDTINLGERSGKLEECLNSLATYYDRRTKLNSAVRSALLYPFVLIIMLAAVMVVLVTAVLPIFAEIYEQMGVELHPFTSDLVIFGKWLTKLSSILIGILAILVVIVVVIYSIPSARRACGAFLRKRFGGKGFFKKALIAQFASAMSTAISSGLDMEESVELAGKIISGVKSTDKELKKCHELINNGESLEKSFSSSGILSTRDSRLLTLGVRTGTADSVMAEIAQRSEERAIEDIDSKLSKIEPTLIVIISVIVGAVLLSVMLPLTGIMSSLG